VNILSIGNSFSHDATVYLHRIAKHGGVELNAATLYIGGCSLERHFRNMMSEKEAYELFYNGEMTGFPVSLKEALLNREWDYITVQQASHLSPDYETYQPYLNEICAYVRKLAPKAKLVVHQTWAYQEGSAKLEAFGKYKNHKEMYADVEKSYKKAAKAIDADMMIESGRLMQLLLDNGVASVHRDGYHLTVGLGRYAAALLWYKTLTGNSVMDNTFCDFDEPVSEKEILLAKKLVEEKL